MNSNLITPTDFVDNELHTVTLIDGTVDDLYLLVNLCQHSETAYNIYLYSTSMNNREWLAEAINRSHAVIVHNVTDNYKDICLLDRAYYYGENQIDSSKKLSGVLQYFSFLDSKNK